ncbi:MAG TPA: TRAP transporter large permease [Vulgatibacteraceae bacterium]|nr:TRAP transporter large permease [Vulgatibacteraceae bacterium]
MPLAIVVAVVGAAIGVPFAFALLLAAIPGINALGLPPYVVPQRMFLQMTSPSFLAIPFFIITGEAMARSGMAMRLVDLARALVGHFRGGLAQSSILMSVGFAAVNGSGVADAAASSRILVPEMKREGYKPTFSAAVLAAGSALGPIIPPSIVMIIYAGMTGLSVSAMFLGGVLPGLVIAAGYMVVVWWVCRGQEDTRHPRASVRQFLTAFRTAMWALIAPAIIIVGILSGYFTATEAGSVAAIYILLVWAFVYRTMTVRALLDVLQEAAITSGVVLMIVSTASIFAWMLGFTDVPGALESFLSGLPAPVLITVVCCVVLIILGCVMDSLAAAIVLVPVIHPIAVGAGLDPLQFAVVVAMSIVVGGITPPVGIYLFIPARAAGVTLWAASRSIVPFLGVVFCVLALAIVWAPLTTWLATAMGP